MIPSTAQATLTNILLSGVPTYGHTAPSPPPGLTPVDVHINTMQTDSKKISAALNGHTQVMPFSKKLVIYAVRKREATGNILPEMK